MSMYLFWYGGSTKRPISVRKEKTQNGPIWQFRRAILKLRCAAWKISHLHSQFGQRNYLVALPARSFLPTTQQTLRIFSSFSSSIYSGGLARQRCTKSSIPKPPPPHLLHQATATTPPSPSRRHRTSIAKPPWSRHHRTPIPKPPWSRRHCFVSARASSFTSNYHSSDNVASEEGETASKEASQEATTERQVCRWCASPAGLFFGPDNSFYHVL
jgi:hypothetical protein